MSKRSNFIFLMRGMETQEIMSDPKAFILLTQIAIRARRSESGPNIHNLKPGEALIGDYHSIGLSEQEYRSAKDRLKRYGIATFKGTNKGTIATLLTSNIYDVNISDGNDQGNGTATDKQRSNNDPITTNKKGKKEKKVKKEKRESGDPPDFSSVEGYFLKEGGKPESADRFYQKHSATGWKLKGDPIVNWESLADSWIDIDKKDQGNNGLTDTNIFRGAFNEKDYTGVANAQAYTNKLDGYSKPFNPEKAKQYYMTDEERKKANGQTYTRNDADDFDLNEETGEITIRKDGVIDGGTF